MPSVVLQSFPSTSPSPSHLNSLIAPTTIGVGLNFILYGLTIAQVFQFYLDCKRDSRWFKSFVGFLFIADTLNTAIDFALLYHTILGAVDISIHGTNDSATKTYWASSADPAVTALVSGAVQSLFAWRIYQLTSNKVATALIALFAFLQTFAGNTLAAVLSTAQSLNQIPLEVSVATEVWLSLALVTNMLITITLVLYLRQRKTGKALIDDSISRLIRVVVQTGGLMTIWVFIDLLLFTTMNNLVNSVFNLPLCKIYTNSLLSCLNARPKCRISEERKVRNHSISRPWEKGTSNFGCNSSIEPAIRPHDTVVSDIVFAGVSGGEAHQLNIVSRTAEYQFELDSTISREYDLTRSHSHIDDDRKEAV